jgi:hypothetical protein
MLEGPTTLSPPTPPHNKFPGPEVSHTVDMELLYGLIEKEGSFLDL